MNSLDEAQTHKLLKPNVFRSHSYRRNPERMLDDKSGILREKKELKRS